MARKSTAGELSEAGLIAPCGMNCGLCYAFLRSRNRCPGCRVDDTAKAKTCVECKIRNCDARREEFCAGCATFPCERLRHLDKRYRTKYGTSMLENLKCIEVEGVRSFAAKDKARWACPGCGRTICVHKKACLVCGEQTDQIRQQG